MQLSFWTLGSWLLSRKGCLHPPTLRYFGVRKYLQGNRGSERLIFLPRSGRETLRASTTLDIMLLLMIMFGVLFRNFLKRQKKTDLILSLVYRHPK